MKPRFIVHIGPPKTGTTSLQTGFAMASDDLADVGVLYPRVLRDTHHRTLATHILGPSAASEMLMFKHKGNADAIAKLSKETWQAMVDGIAHHKPHTVVLSSEMFFALGRNPDIGNLIDAFRALASDLTLVAYLRAPAPRYLSLRQQRVKKLGLKPPPVPMQIYRKSLEPYSEINGITLDVHEFDRAKLTGGDVLTDFTQRYLSPPAVAAFPAQAIVNNTSISAEAIALFEDIWTGNHPARANHLTLPDRGLVIDVIEKDLELTGKSRPSYKPGIASIVHKTTRDLDWINDTFGINFAAPAPDPVADDMTAADLIGIRDVAHVDAARLDALWDVVLNTPPLRRKSNAPNGQPDHINFRGSADQIAPK